MPKVTNFSVVPLKYDPHDFVVPARDHTGQSARVYCRVAPMVDRALDEIWLSRKFPFKSKGDIIRWCIHSGMDRLNQMEGVVSVFQQIGVINELCRQDDLQHDFISVFQSMGSTINRHISTGATGEARRLVAKVRALIDRMPDGYWRDSYLKKLDESFGHLIRDAPTSKIQKSKDGEER